MVGQPDFLSNQQDENYNKIEKELKNPKGELHLRFYLPSGDEFALSAMGIREVMQQEPDRITPIPNASPLLLGTINLRGQIIWVADLGHFLGDPVVLNTQRPEIPVIAIEEQETILGLAVERLGEMQWLDIQQLSRPTNVPDYIDPFVQGEWVLLNKEEETKQEKQFVRLLDHIAIMRSARWGA